MEKTWSRYDKNTCHFALPNSAGPLWSTVTRRITYNARTGLKIEDLKVLDAVSFTCLQHKLPPSITFILTIFYNGDGDTNNDLRKRKKSRRYDTSKYCWKYGAWNHHSKDCKFKAEGHEDNTKNMLGGSTEYCQVCNWKTGDDEENFSTQKCKIKKMNSFLESFSSSSKKIVDITFDSEASHNYIRWSDKKLLLNVKPYCGQPVLLLLDADV